VTKRNIIMPMIIISFDVLNYPAASNCDTAFVIHYVMKILTLCRFMTKSDK